mmetsp:Transcript_40569/g.160883  ORF Transcript_40569/g.160883 Transcript_40569/m.160883 type:complete len:256 (-) Transcript_40569:108-875(-)
MDQNIEETTECLVVGRTVQRSSSFLHSRFRRISRDVVLPIASDPVLTKSFRPPAQIERIHTERVRCVLLESPDLVAFETIPDSDEVRTILRLMEANFSDTPFWVSLQCQSESKLADGSNLDTISAYIKELAPTSMVALGVNCVHPELVRPVIERIRSGLGSNTQILTMCYPNSGEVWEEVDAPNLHSVFTLFSRAPTTHTHLVFGAAEQGWKHVEGKTPSPEEWSNIVVRSGADIVGGCCRTTTSHIRLLRELLY